MGSTSQAQPPGTWTFEYALVPHAGAWRDDAEVQRQAQAFQAALRAMMIRAREGALPQGLAFQDVRLARLDEAPLGKEQQRHLERLSEQSPHICLRAGEMVTLLLNCYFNC